MDSFSTDFSEKVVNMLIRRFFIGALLLAVAGFVNVSMAQGPGGGGPGGFFGGPGGGRAGGAMLLGIPEVQKELNLTDDQKEAIKKEGESVRQEIQKMREGFDPASLADMSDEERTKKFQEMRKKGEEIGAKVEEKMKTVLDAKQLERLTELQYQQQSGNALLRPEVIKKLNITDEQQEKLKKISEGARPAPGTFRNFGNMSDDDRKAMREKMQSSQKEMLAVLTDEQSEDWTKMTGKEFKFPPMGRGGRGGFGGPGGGPSAPPPAQ